MFIDELTIVVRSGAGGRGAESHRNRSDHKRVPDGGDGADGGDVIVRADRDTASLLSLKSKRIFEAERGGLGEGNGRYGRRGKDCIVKVPCGTTIYQARDHLLIRDLVEPGDEVVIVKGGHGGYGNHSGRPATGGKDGVETELLLSFKIIADIFLVGLPNSGKTTLLKRLTGASVSESDYPFATKMPLLGTYRTSEEEARICELPSIYGSSTNGRGLGTHFLKHLERARLIFLVLTPETEFAPDLKTGYDILLKTIEDFNSAFLSIPRLIVVNKSDLSSKKIVLGVFPEDEKVFPVSLLKDSGIERLMKEAARILAGKSCAKA